MGGFKFPLFVPVDRNLLAEFVRDEDEWTLDEWRAHSLRLRKMVRELQAELTTVKARHTRRKKPQKIPKSQRIPTLKLSRREEKAWEVLFIRKELEAANKKVTDKQALAEWYKRKGMRPSRAASDRTTLNAVSALRGRLNQSLK
jgi:hypothetical protein